MRYRLHLFPFSNYCEKTLWALEHLGIAHTRQLHFPGPHSSKIRKLSNQTSVPVLEDEGIVIAGSAEIISHVMQDVPNPDLMPPEHKTEILKWQARLDGIGGTLRGALFHDILGNPSLAIGLLSAGQKRPLSGYGLFFRAMTPMLKRMLKQNVPDASIARETCKAVLSEVSEAAASTGYLVGDRFSLADLAAAAIFFPIAMPKGAMGYEFARNTPALTPWLNHWCDHPGVAYVERIYDQHRQHVMQTR